MRNSIRTRYTLILVLTIAAVIGGTTLFNCFFMESYVIHQKLNEVRHTINQVEAYIESGFDEEEELQLLRSCSANNIGAYVYNVGNSLLPQVKCATNYNWDSLSKRFEDYLWGNGLHADEIYENNDSYILYRVFDNRMNSSQIECLGGLGHAKYIITTSLEGVHASVAATNRFLLFVGIGGALFGGIAIFFISRRFSQPILELASLSEQMAELNFSVRYQEKRKDEIGILGDSMNRMSERLEQTIKELQEANARLNEDIRRKEQIDERRREFLSNVSHELKTPIALIQGYSEGLKDGIADADPESRDYYCDVIIDEARKMNHIVKRLLNLDEIESGTMEPQWEEFDLVDLLRGVIQTSSMLSGEKTCETELKSPEHLPVSADEFMIEEVMQNYLSNAYHYVSDPGKITVEAEALSNGGVKVSVTNTGEWIPEQDLSQIWEKFYKVDKARTRSYGGSGIGLSIVKAIMKSHGGACGVENVEGGVQFWFSWNPLTAQTIDQ